MAVVPVYMKCPQCNGTGEQYSGSGTGQVGPFECTWPDCENGYIECGFMQMNVNAIITKLDDILSTVNTILEEVQG